MFRAKNGKTGAFKKINLHKERIFTFLLKQKVKNRRFQKVYLDENRYSCSQNENRYFRSLLTATAHEPICNKIWAIAH